MTQNEKDLLLKDLCARLPYGVRAYYNDYDSDYEIESIKITSYGDYKTGRIHLDMIDSTKIVDIDEIKPYLFPLSSMTNAQEEELDKYLEMDSKSLIDGYKNGLRCAHPYFNVQDWYNKNHFDYRGLIPMGLANDATGLNIY